MGAAYHEVVTVETVADEGTAVVEYICRVIGCLIRIHMNFKTGLLFLCFLQNTNGVLTTTLMLQRLLNIVRVVGTNAINDESQPRSTTELLEAIHPQAVLWSDWFGVVKGRNKIHNYFFVPDYPSPTVTVAFGPTLRFRTNQLIQPNGQFDVPGIFRAGFTPGATRLAREFFTQYSDTLVIPAIFEIGGESMYLWQEFMFDPGETRIRYIYEEFNANLTDRMFGGESDTIFCERLLQRCPGQYDNLQDCEQFMNAVGRHSHASECLEAQGNSSYCRRSHLGIALYDSELHCPHVGPHGGPDIVGGIVCQDSACSASPPQWMRDGMGERWYGPLAREQWMHHMQSGTDHPPNWNQHYKFIGSGQ